MNTSANNIMVSVCMITYNHEKFIAQAIEGVLMQQTSFPIELVIGEDCSTDHTRQICKKYKEKYPDKIQLLLSNSNQGMIRNFYSTLHACNSKFIALCEGDDYWADPYKLQKQVDFLEANSDFSICFHNVKIWSEQENRLIDDYITLGVPDTTTILDLAQGNYIHTPSVVFRKNEDVLKTFVEINPTIGDYTLHMLNAKYGKIKKLSDCMAVYRLHPNGVWGQKESEYKLSIWIHLLDSLLPFFNQNIQDILKLQLGQHTTIYSIALIDQNKVNNHTKFYFEKASTNNPDYLYKEIVNKIRFLKEENRHLRNTKAYKLGKAILKPFSYLKSKIINYQCFR